MKTHEMPPWFQTEIKAAVKRANAQLKKAEQEFLTAKQDAEEASRYLECDHHVVGDPGSVGAFTERCTNCGYSWTV